MTKNLRRAAVAVVLAIALGMSATPSARADDPTNAATAINTQDGSSVFRFALSVRNVADGVVDETNTATAEASCTDCTTIAIAFQVILVSGDPNYVAPENKATAVNVDCAECLTYAKATQIVVDMEGKVLTKNGKRRLAELERRMEEVERNADNMTDAELLAAAQAAQAELIAIFNEELVPDDSATSTTTTTSSTSTTTSSGSSTTTTVRTTTTTATPETTSPSTSTSAAT
jgi:putative peptide zinc metalloprotease protein